jgi:endoglucanase
MTMRLTTAALAALVLFSGCGGTGGGTSVPVAAAPVPPAATTPPPTAHPVAPGPAVPITQAAQMIHAQGAKWVTADGTEVHLKGANIGNWLINEFWMMGQGSNGIDTQCKLEAVLDKRFGYAERDRLFKLFRDNWMTPADWDQLAQFGVNVVRLPFIHTLVEDERHPGSLRADAWHYLDDAIAQAERRGIYVILDLHGAAGGQAGEKEQHDGCLGPAALWTTPAYQDRTVWLWQQVAARYKDRPAVAGYSLLNEPWGTDPATLAAFVGKLYTAVRAVDPNHVAILPGHSSGIGAYGDPASKGMTNVAFEMHFYPGLFGWGAIGPAVHRDWLLCNAAKTTGVCEWDKRIQGLRTPFLVGETQPWASMGLETGAQVTRATFDTYAKLGWATTAWAYKYASNAGGHGTGTWGMVTNAAGDTIPALDFNTASLADIENLFKRYGSVRYEPHRPLRDWMTSSNAPDPFAGL